MAEFIYSWQGYDQSNQLHYGELLSQSAIQARQKLTLQGIIPIKLTRNCRFCAKHWRLEQRIIITRQLGIMLQAGLPLVSTLQLLAEQHASVVWRYILHTLANELIKGTTFSEALNQFPRIFPVDYQQVIATGELTGELAECCIHLAEQQESILTLRKRISKALHYPLFLMFILVIVVLLMLLFVLPQFSEIYQSVGAELPWFTQGLIQSASIARHYGIPALLISIFLISIYGYCWQHYPHLRYCQQQWLLHIPLYGPLIMASCLAKTFRILALTQQAGITLADGLRVTALCINNLVYQFHIEQYNACILQGMPFYQAVSQDNFFPTVAGQFIRVGEESGTLDSMLMRLSDLFEQQTHILAEQFTQKLEPLMMIILGIIVGGLVVAMYLPLLQLGQVIQ